MQDGKIVSLWDRKTKHMIIIAKRKETVYSYAFTM